VKTALCLKGADGGQSIGDAENDHAFLRASGYAVAVANALPAIKDEADLVTKGARDAGVAELIRMVLENDVDAFRSSETHSSVEVSIDRDGRPIFVRPHGACALICGSSGGGKSTVATALLERIVARDFQVCVFDPEGDYSEFRSAVVSAIANLRAQIGRPHWILMDEAHHLLPADRDVSATASLESLPPVILVTVDPRGVSRRRLGAG